MTKTYVATKVDVVTLVSTEGRTRAGVTTKCYVVTVIEAAIEHLGRDKNNSFKRVVRVATTQQCHEMPDDNLSSHSLLMS